MSELSATPYLHNLPSPAHDSQAGLAAKSGDSDLLQHAASVHAALFQPPAASDSNVLDIQSAGGIPAEADAHARHILGFVGSR